MGEHDGHGVVEFNAVGHMPCECISKMKGWGIDCSHVDHAVAAAEYVKDASNGCLVDGGASHGLSSECLDNYHVFQAHHDYCPPDSMPIDFETTFHMFEGVFEDCHILRATNVLLNDCPDVHCDDVQELVEAVELMYSQECSLDCDAPACAETFQTIMAAHDTCPEGGLPVMLEVALHEFEAACASHACNAPHSLSSLGTQDCSMYEADKHDAVARGYTTTIRLPSATEDLIEDSFGASAMAATFSLLAFVGVGVVMYKVYGMSRMSPNKHIAMIDHGVSTP